MLHTFTEEYTKDSTVDCSCFPVACVAFFFFSRCCSCCSFRVCMCGGVLFKLSRPSFLTHIYAPLPFSRNHCIKFCNKCTASRQLFLFFVFFSFSSLNLDAQAYASLSLFFHGMKYSTCLMFGQCKKHFASPLNLARVASWSQHSLVFFFGFFLLLFSNYNNPSPFVFTVVQHSLLSFPFLLRFLIKSTAVQSWILFLLLLFPCSLSHPLAMPLWQVALTPLFAVVVVVLLCVVSFSLLLHHPWIYICTSLTVRDDDSARRRSAQPTGLIVLRLPCEKPLEYRLSLPLRSVVQDGVSLSLSRVGLREFSSPWTVFFFVFFFFRRERSHLGVGAIGP